MNLKYLLAASAKSRLRALKEKSSVFSRPLPVVFLFLFAELMVLLGKCSVQKQAFSADVELLWLRLIAQDEWIDFATRHQTVLSRTLYFVVQAWFRSHAGLVRRRELHLALYFPLFKRCTMDSLAITLRFIFRSANILRCFLSQWNRLRWFQVTQLVPSPLSLQADDRPKVLRSTRLVACVLVVAWLLNHELRFQFTEASLELQARRLWTDINKLVKI